MPAMRRVIFVWGPILILVCASRAAGTSIVDSLDVAVTGADRVYVGTIRRAIPCGSRQAPHRHFLVLDVARTLKGPAAETLQCSVDEPPNVAQLGEWALRGTSLLLCLEEARDAAGGIDEMMPPVVAVHGQAAMIPLDGTAEVLSSDLTALRSAEAITAWARAAIDAADDGARANRGRTPRSRSTCRLRPPARRACWCFSATCRTD